MDFVSGIIVYFITWWVVFFMALPFGGQASYAPKFGHDTGAPKATYLKQKILATTFISLLIWFGIDYLISINFIDFRTLGRAL